MNDKIRQLFEEHSYPNFPGIILKRKNTGEYESDILEDHWQTFQEGFELAIRDIIENIKEWEKDSRNHISYMVTNEYLERK